MARLVVQHCILATTVRQYGSRPTSDLLGVDYTYTVPADTEFPRIASRLEVFLRFYVTGLKRPKPIRITVSHLDADGNHREVIFQYQFLLSTLSPSGTLVVDRSVKLVNMSLPGPGTYCVRVLRRAKRVWDHRPQWRVAKVEYFSVERA